MSWRDFPKPLFGQKIIDTTDVCSIIDYESTNTGWIDFHGGELCERSFAHCYETGGLRRLHVRGRENVLRRLLVQDAAFNLGLLLWRLGGGGKPRSGAAHKAALPACWDRLDDLWMAFQAAIRLTRRLRDESWAQIAQVSLIFAAT